MKKIIATALLLVVAGAATAQAGVDFHVNVGIPVPMPPAVTVHYPSQPRVIHQEYVREEAPRFIYSQNLGFYVSVGTPTDIVYLNHGYYDYRGGSWYNAATYGGPWTAVSHRKLPRELRKHRYEQVRHFRDREYRAYLRDGERYRGSWHRPSGVHEVAHRDDRRNHRWDDRRDHRWNDRKDHRGDDRRDDRKDHRGNDRKDDRRDGRH